MNEDSVNRTVEKLRAAKKRAQILKEKSAQGLEEVQIPEGESAQDLEIKKVQAPRNWRTLKKWVNEHCDVCNARMKERMLKFRTTKANEFDVIMKPLDFEETVHVVFNPKMFAIRYEGKSSSTWMMLANKNLESRAAMFVPTVDGKQLFYALRGVRMRTVEEMGEALIDPLFVGNLS